MIPKIGQRVKVVKLSDECGDKYFVGRTGRVIDYDYTSHCGQSHNDPLIVVGFKKRQDSFWKEELRTV
jgi:hypothetical protein